MRILTLFVVLALFWGCKEKEDPLPEDPGDVSVIVVNEGNFGWGEGSLTGYNPLDHTVQHDVYRTTNGSGVGNVLQSVSRWNDELFLVVNNSNKLIVTDTVYKKVYEWTGFTSPRYLYPVGGSKAYLTDLYQSAIYVLDLDSRQVTKEIPVNGWAEKGVIVNNQFWFTAPNTSNVYVVDIATDAVIDSVGIGYGTESIVLDAAQHVWVLNKGDSDKGEIPRLSRVNPVAREVTRSILLGLVPANLVYHPPSNSLLFFNDGLRSLSVSEGSQVELKASGKDRNFYGLGVDPTNGDIYASDIHDFTSNSTIHRWNSEWVKQQEFYAGVISGNFFFRGN